MKNNNFTIRLSNIPTTAKDLAGKLRGGEVFALIGSLGAGKTTFVKALGKELRVRNRITSPTFTLLHEYQGKMPQSREPLHIYHLDLYRTQNFREVANTGILEVWSMPGTVTLIEWADKITKHLPKQTTTILFEHEDI